MIGSVVLLPMALRLHEHASANFVVPEVFRLYEWPCKIMRCRTRCGKSYHDFVKYADNEITTGLVPLAGGTPHYSGSMRLGRTADMPRRFVAPARRFRRVSSSTVRPGAGRCGTGATAWRAGGNQYYGKPVSSQRVHGPVAESGRIGMRLLRPIGRGGELVVIPMMGMPLFSGSPIMAGGCPMGHLL